MSELSNHIQEWRDRINNPKAIVSEVRTIKQNSSYWKWLTLLAESLNDAGYCQNDKVVITCDVPFTKDSLHELAAKPYLNKLYPEKTSTTQLTTTEEMELYKFVDQAIASRTGCHVEWPSEESLSEQQRDGRAA